MAPKATRAMATAQGSARRMMWALFSGLLVHPRFSWPGLAADRGPRIPEGSPVPWTVCRGSLGAPNRLQGRRLRAWHAGVDLVQGFTYLNRRCGRCQSAPGRGSAAA